MKQHKFDITPHLILAGVALVGWAYLREDPQCDQGCKTRLDHLLQHALPLLLKGNPQPVDLIALGVDVLSTEPTDLVSFGESPYYPYYLS